ATNIATDGGNGITFIGAVEFASGITVDTSVANRPVTFDGDVTAAGPLAFNVGTATVVLRDGTWNQGTGNLSITSTGTGAFEIGDASNDPATFAMSGGVLALNVAANGTALTVFADGTFKVGSVAGAAEVVTIDTGAVNTDVSFASTASRSGLQVGF